jgi:hypothetical protein
MSKKYSEDEQRVLDEGHELSAEEILSADDLTVQGPIPIPEWKGVLYFKTMPADEFIKFQKLVDGPAKSDAWVRILQQCACNKAGSLLFTTAQLERLRTKNTAVFLRFQKQLLALHGVGQEIEEALKNA